jgi:hypothetical protein
MPINLLFWAVLAALVVHILDETLMNGGFVAKVKEHWWPEYNATMFFWFNTAALVLIALCLILYDLLEGHWVILPLFWTFERAVHGVTFHGWWTVGYREYSPGLLSCVLFWILLYFVTRYGLVAGRIADSDFLIGGITGTVGAILLTLSPTVIFPRLMAKNAMARDR